MKCKCKGEVFAWPNKNCVKCGGSTNHKSKVNTLPAGPRPKETTP